MGFLEKVKNMFTEEVEEDEIKVEKIKHKSKKANKAKNVDFDIEDQDDKVNEDDKKELDVSKKIEEEKKSKPVFFSDDDFDDIEKREKEKREKKKREEQIRLDRERYERELRERERLELLKREELRKKKIEEEARLNYYSNKKEESSYEYGNAIPKEEPRKEEVRKIFKPTPIISPVYGVLDKNYHKEDIVSRDEVKARKEASVESPIDLVRNKAYGTLEDELENTLFGNNSILFKNEDTEKEVNEEKENIEEITKDDLSNLTDDIGKELDELLSKKGINKEISSNKKESNDIEDDLLDFIDSTLYKKGDE